jgi:hypothetical protein
MAGGSGEGRSIHSFIHSFTRRLWSTPVADFYSFFSKHPSESIQPPTTPFDFFVVNFLSLFVFLRSFSPPSSGNLAQGNWVPWEAQAANNNPELLVWREEASCITTTVPGLYHLSLGFFTHSPVVIQVRPRIASHRIASHRIASHRIASHACVLAPIEESKNESAWFSPSLQSHERYQRIIHSYPPSNPSRMHACMQFNQTT